MDPGLHFPKPDPHRSQPRAGWFAVTARATFSELRPGRQWMDIAWGPLRRSPAERPDDSKL